MKKRIVALILAAAAAGAAVFFALRKDEVKEQTFDEFKEKFLYSFYGDDISYWNSIAVDPSNIGYHRGEDVKAEMDKYEDYKKAQTDDYEEVKDLMKDYGRFNRDTLSDREKAEYDAIGFRLELLEESTGPGCGWYPMLYGYISQYGGYVADFISTTADYELRNRQDVTDIIDYVRSTAEAFATYDDYARDRAGDGIPFSDYTLDKMTEYLNGVTGKGDDFYLYGVVDRKICETDFLGADEKAGYRSDFKNAMDTCFMPACAQLAEDLEGLKGYWTDPDESYVAHYKDRYEGYYSWKLRSVLGMSEIDPDEYGSTVIEWLNEVYDENSEIIDRFENEDSPEHRKYLDCYSDEDSCFGCATYDEIMRMLLFYSDNVVEPIENCPEITVKEEDETAGDFASYLAYYVYSPEDEKYSPTEKITFNPHKRSDAATKIFTLAHEGYPGHLYAHVLAKQQDCAPIPEMVKTLGASEGWAQYAAFAVLNSIAEVTEDKTVSVVAAYISVKEYFQYLNAGVMDYLVNGCCLTAAQLAQVFDVSEESAAENILHYCDENVAGISCYGFGFRKMLDAHEYAGENASAYDEKEFNTYIISNYGLFGLDKLEEVTEMYVKTH